MAALDHLGDVEPQIVAEVVEAELVVRAIGDVAAVSLAARAVVHTRKNDADRKAEEAMNPADLLRIAGGEVVVDGDDVNALSRDRI
ncbi:hypothetical protein D3C87_1941630 [compost metagenome]